MVLGPKSWRFIDVLKAAGDKFGFGLEYESADIGGVAIDNHGVAFPDSTKDVCDKAEAILFGSVGGPNGKHFLLRNNPSALLCFRSARLIRSTQTCVLASYPELTNASPLKKERIPTGIDIVCIRELTGGIYFGQPKATTTLENGEEQAIDTMVYKTSEIERIAQVASDTANRSSWQAGLLG